jgi:hypothetical protein
LAIRALPSGEPYPIPTSTGNRKAISGLSLSAIESKPSRDGRIKTSQFFCLKRCVPKAVQILHIVSLIGFLIPGICLAPVVFVVPVLLLLGQMSVTWKHVLFFLLAALGVGIMFVIYTAMQEDK